jgi:hypothetical protein
VSAINGNGEGPLSNAVSDTPPAAGTTTALSHNSWANGNITVAGAVDWYKFTAPAAATYHLQWDDRYNSTGGKTLYAHVSVYRGDGTMVLTNMANGYTYPRPISVSMGETVYVRVEGQFGCTGTYAVRYYDPTSLPPQTAPSHIEVYGNPAPACVVAWGDVAGATGYRVYRSTTGTFGSTPYTTLSGEYATAYMIDADVTAGTTYYYKVSAINGNGEGPLSNAVSDTPPAAGTTTLLTLGAWTTGNLSTATQADWYRITFGTAGTYYLQWDDRYEGSGTYSGDLEVSAWHTDGTPLFTYMDSGYSDPPSWYFNAGETLYVRVTPYRNEIEFVGPYAVRYYE